MPVIHNAREHQFEVREGEHLARLAYRLDDDDVMDIVHTEVPKELEGRGIAGDLAKAALEFAVKHELVVRPTCPFVRSYLERHPTNVKIV